MTVWQLYNHVKRGDVELRSIECVVVDPPNWNKTRYNKRDEYNFLIGTPELIIEYAIKLAKLINSKYLLLHYNEQLYHNAILYLVEYMWFARYLYTENKNISYYILYNVDKL